jgi:hydrogenase maturation protease
MTSSESSASVFNLTDLPVCRHILVACIGNLFLGDDGFGVEVARHLFMQKVQGTADEVEIIDFGIRGMELAYTLLDDYDALVLVDAVPRGKMPGTLYLLEVPWPDINPTQSLALSQTALDAHSMDPIKVLAFAKRIGARPIYTLLIGCEPSVPTGDGGYEEMQTGLSEPVQNAVGQAVKIIAAVIKKLQRDEQDYYQ